MNAGRLRETITILQPVVVKDNYGANLIEWRDITSTRANAKANTGNRSNENDEIVHLYTVTFTIRYYHNVKEDMRIIWNKKKYRILSVIKEYYTQTVTIVTELINE